MSETLGASFQIDVTNLKKGLTQANRLIRESNSEFKAAAAIFRGSQQLSMNFKGRVFDAF